MGFSRGSVIRLLQKNKTNRSIYLSIYLYICHCLVTQLCPTLCNAIDCRPPGSSILGVPQACASRSAMSNSWRPHDKKQKQNKSQKTPTIDWLAYKQQKYIFHNSGGWKSKIKVPVDSESVICLLPGSQIDIFSLCPHTSRNEEALWFFL